MLLPQVGSFRGNPVWIFAKKWKIQTFASRINLFPSHFLGLLFGHFFPMMELSKDAWIWLTLSYCFFAAVLPVGVLLQPRDFLSAGFLYAILGLGALGMLMSGESLELPLFIGWESEKLGMLVPFLFITVACGACSGFHSIVASGTTSKQIRRERDTRRVTYGGMLLEGVLAVFALACVAVLTVGEREAGGSPVGVFATGASKFFAAVGIPAKLGIEFAMLAISTFLLTTLDTCTRLTRFLIEELFSWRNQASRYLGTLAALALPAGWFFNPLPHKMVHLFQHGKPYGHYLERLISSLLPLPCLLSSSF